MISSQSHMLAEPVKTLAESFSTSKRSEIDAAWALAEPLGDELLGQLAEAFPHIGKFEGRASIMRYVGKFSRTNEIAFGMALAATRDRSYDVRHYGCAALAYSLRVTAPPTLSSLLAHSDGRTVNDAKAAIDAIRSKNHNFFRDRAHTGKILWEYGST
jgi:hypothetical protein